MTKKSELSSKNCSVYINNEKFNFKVEGTFFSGKNQVLFNQENSVLANVDWADKGYSIIPVFSENTFKLLQNSITKNIIDGLKKAGIHTNFEDFNLNDYHKYAVTPEQHFEVINHTRNLRNEDFDIDFKTLEKVFSEYLNIPLTSKIKEFDRSHIQIRISRPDSLDINPPHRDSYLDYYKDILNIWIPISGCNENSSLPIVPGSHLIPENKITRTEARSAYINGNLYAVPCMLETTEGPFKMIRPNPQPGEALIFTPYLVHGVGINLNKDITRVSLELRFDKL